MTYKIIGKYINDLEFSIPNPKTFFLLSKDISNYKINIDIKSKQIKQNIIEVLTTLNLSPAKLSNDKIDKKEMERIVLVDVPSQIYSELRSIFISLFENSGFKDIKINEKIDFQKLYSSRKIQ